MQRQFNAFIKRLSALCALHFPRASHLPSFSSLPEEGKEVSLALALALALALLSLASGFGLHVRGLMT